ncbi:Rnase H [Cellulophaga phage phi19:2]|uniref:Rnase H n=3 Tax=Cellulophaga phage phiST TaxID=756282 RepID=M4SN95_9CAUD|nr:hypothetical protein CGPG_00046 [Cellulophaga phage phiST]AGH56745.1 hypothetical protein CGPG_00046 [Cellulophaga phage phiST]AGO47202.1 Rnase H [Cellulophaga phage phiST]AGO48698.1 Rnase H [Cellulophaga phage phi19:2]AGO49068.1 Rnase H [Cellulophaga phage phi13:1]
MKTITAFTDGSAVVRGSRKGNGGFGTYFPDLFGKQKAFSQGYQQTKTGRMEITALYYALKAFPETSEESIILEVYSDSEYVVKTFTEKRLERWVMNNWTNTSGLVKNRDLWEAILKQLKTKKYLILRMNHIKAHSLEKCSPEERSELLQNELIKGNAIADKLADYKRHSFLKKSDKL